MQRRHQKVIEIAPAPNLDDAVRQDLHRYAVAFARSIGIDFPTVAGKAERLAVAAAIDAALPMPFERTAMNGFGFLQIVRPRPRASLPERWRADPAAAAARALLRQIERAPPRADRRHRVTPPVHAALTARPHWLAELARRTGVVHEWESA